jgi:hypothetical protein
LKSCNRCAELAERSDVAKHRAAADAELEGEGLHGRDFATTKQVGELHQSLGARHLVTVSVTRARYVNSKRTVEAPGRTSTAIDEGQQP